jgi:hypothetical protein
MAEVIEHEVEADGGQIVEFPVVEEAILSHESDEELGEEGAPVVDLELEGVPSVEPEAEEKADDDKQKEEEEEVEDESQYGTKVKKRIGNLTGKLRESERQVNDAVGYGRAMYKENLKLQEKMKELDSGLVTQFDARTTVELDAATQRLADGHAANNPEEIAEATKDVARLSIDSERARVAIERVKNDSEAEVVASKPDAPQPTKPAEDPVLTAWKADNDWFNPNTNPDMYHYAMGVHTELLGSGVDIGSEAYYNTINKRVKGHFPRHFVDDVDAPDPKPRKKSQTVAPVLAKGSAPGTKAIKLSARQRGLAHRMGIPLDAYAANVAKARQKKEDTVNGN